MASRRLLVLVSVVLMSAGLVAAEASVSVFVSTIYGASSLSGLRLENASAAIPWVGLGSWSRVELYGPAYVNDTVEIEPGDILIPHMYYLHFNGGKIVWQTSPYLEVDKFTAVSGARMWQDNIWRNGVMTTGTFTFGFAFTRGFYYVFSNGTYTLKNEEYNDVEIRVPTRVGEYYVFGAIAGSTEALGRVYLWNGTVYAEATYPYPEDFGAPVLEKSGSQLQLAMGLTWEAPKPIDLRYLVIYNDTRDWSAVEDTAFNHVVYKPAFFFDPSLYNGTYYYDLVTGEPGSVQKGEVDLEWDSRTWFWVVRGLRDDGYVHFEYMKPGVLLVTNETGHVVLYKVITEENENLTVYLKPGRYTIEYQPFGAPVGAPQASPTAVANDRLVEDGTIIAPHTRKFLFDGRSYALYSGFSSLSEYTILTRVTAINVSGSGDKDVFGMSYGAYYEAPFTLSVWRGYYAIVFQCELCMPYIPVHVGNTSLIYMAARYGDVGRIANLLTGENSTKTGVEWASIENGNFLIGANSRGALRYFNGTVGYIVILKKYLDPDNSIVYDAYSRHVVDYSLLHALFDPSFYDPSSGTLYVIGNPTTGTLVGSARIVRDNESWVWVVHGAPLSGVDIRYSRGVYLFKDQTGSVYAVPVAWEARAWLPSGVYTIEYYENETLAGLGYRGVKVAVPSGMNDLRGKTVLLWVYLKSPMDIIVELESGNGELLVYPKPGLHPGWNLIVIPSQPRPYPESYPYPHALLGNYDAGDVKSITILYRGYVGLGGLALSSVTAVSKIQVLGSGATLGDVLEALRYENLTEWGVDSLGRQVFVVPSELVVGDGRVYSTLSMSNSSLAVYSSGLDAIVVMDSASLSVCGSTLYVKGSEYALRSSSAAYVELVNTKIYAGGSIVLSSASRILNTDIIGGYTSIAVGNSYIRGLRVEGTLELTGDAVEGAVSNVRADRLIISPVNTTWLSGVEAGELVVTGGEVYLIDSPYSLANRTVFNGTASLHMLYTVNLLPSFNAYVESGYVRVVDRNGSLLAEAPVANGSSTFEVEVLGEYYNSSSGILSIVNHNPVSILVYDNTGFLVANITTNITRPLTVSTANGTNYYISLNTWTDKGGYTPGEPVIIYASVSGLKASSVNATVVGPNTTARLTLHDDGVYPDELGGDGIWSGLYMGDNTTGKYRVLVDARVGDTIIRGETWFTVENITASANTTGAGVSLMGLGIEPPPKAAIHDGVIVLLLVIAALAPLVYRRYPFNTAINRLVYEGLVLIASILIMSTRSVIITNAYIVNTDNGTTIVPVYASNPFMKIYIFPLMISIALLLKELIELVETYMRSI